ncbi:hypothetical protein T07_11778 [Trichinella nelsoni]|uniref:Uncharacterized protein n=1 Tax=Trichinella nelsoni TaxID=6336 RepID=A0A0V0SDU2_9BILA|nr:hypothetical protein T07_11778 [Trichinella nelsoni]
MKLLTVKNSIAIARYSIQVICEFMKSLSTASIKHLFSCFSRERKQAIIKHTFMTLKNYHFEMHTFCLNYTTYISDLLAFYTANKKNFPQPILNIIKWRGCG